jgi:glycosyltransferase involved in cell wall biosynthesis
LDVEVLDIQPATGRHATVANYRRPRSALARGRFGVRVRELARDADVVHLEEVMTGWCGGFRTPTVLHVHHLHALDVDLPRPWSRDFLLALENRRADRLVTRRHRRLVASSPVVARALRDLAPRATVHEAPLSLEPTYYERAPLDGPPLAGLIGTAAWPPTRAAVSRAVTRIWPRVLERSAGATLRVAGRGTDMLALSAPGVEIVGEVPSGSAFLRELSVLLYPVPRGSGAKVKVLEALASGLPVVTTSHGAEGIEPGDGVIVVDDDAGLAAATVRLLGDEAERRERGAAARRMFDERHSPIAATQPLVGLYESAVAAISSHRPGSSSV